MAPAKGNTLNGKYTARSTSALAVADSLVEMGVPVFACRLTGNGDPIPPDKWQQIKPSHEAVARWRPGMALCAVTGIKFDVLDVDPRNGGALSVRRLNNALGEDGPDEWWRVRTPSGGLHIWITPLGIGSRPGFLPGIDLKGGAPDGSSRGFVFIPPTVRPSKSPGPTFGDMFPYTALSEPSRADGPPCEALISFVNATVREAVRGPNGQGRQSGSSLRAEVLAAPDGAQRDALLRWVGELERKGYEPDDIVALCLALPLRSYNARRPWKEADFRSLLHAPGEVIGDGTAGELDGMLSPRIAGRELRSLASAEYRLTEWMWYRYLAFGDATILDADPGTGKSLITIDVAARFSRGWPMPGEDKALCRPGNVLLLAPEDRPEVIRGRVDAAGGDLSRIFLPPVELVGRGKNRKAAYKGHMMTFPDGIGQFRDWIESEDIGLVIVDPIAAFLSENVNSHNDASVRRALEPFVYVLGESECSGFLLRHLNKDKSKDVRNRGGGSVAFGAVARIQLFAAELPTGVGVSAGFGIVCVKNNHMAVDKSACLTYAVVDSPIVADSEGGKVPCLEWHGIVEVSPSYLASGDKVRKGPEAWVQPDVEEVLEQLFDIKDEWAASEVLKQMKEAGVTCSRPVLDKVKKKLQIRSVKRFNDADGVSYWVWTVAKSRLNGADSDDA